VKKPAPAKKAPVKKAPPAKKPAPAKKVAPVKKAAPVVKKAAPVQKAPAAKKLPVLVKKKPAPQVKVTGWLGKQRERLLQLKDTLLDSMSGVGRDSLRNRAEGSEASAFGMHTADASSDAYDRDFALSLLSQERDSLFEIDAALKKSTTATTASASSPASRFPTTASKLFHSHATPSSARPSWRKPTASHASASLSPPSSGLVEEGESESEEEDTTTDTKD
jgi:hypothetical protein